MLRKFITVNGKLFHACITVKQKKPFPSVRCYVWHEKFVVKTTTSADETKLPLRARNLQYVPKTLLYDRERESVLCISAGMSVCSATQSVAVGVPRVIAERFSQLRCGAESASEGEGRLGGGRSYMPAERSCCFLRPRCLQYIGLVQLNVSDPLVQTSAECVAETAL